MTSWNPLPYLAGRREDLCQGKARRMGLTRLLQAPHGGRPLFGAQFRPSCQPSGRPAWVQRRKGRAACFETQPSHSPPSRELKFVHLDVAAPAALSLIASVSNRASYHYCRPPREGGDEETLFGGIPLRPAREAHDAQGKSPMKQF
jgi:hypothetical protein